MFNIPIGAKVSGPVRKSAGRWFEGGLAALSVFATVVVGTPALAQRAPNATSAVADRLYTLDCGLTEFTDAAYFSDTVEYDGKALALPTPVLPDPARHVLAVMGYRQR